MSCAFDPKEHRFPFVGQHEDGSTQEIFSHAVHFQILTLYSSAKPHTHRIIIVCGFPNCRKWVCANDHAVLPVAGNVCIQGVKPSKFDNEMLVGLNFDPGIQLVRKDGGWYLEIAVDPALQTIF